MLRVNSRVTSAALRVSRPRSRQTRRAWEARSTGWREPTLGGTADSSGPSTSARPAIQASQRSSASASRGENLAISSRRRAGSPASWGGGPRAVGPVAVAVEVEVADDPLGNQADDVRQRGHPVGGPERPLGDGGAPDDLPGLADQRPGARPGQVGGGDQPVVAAPDDDRVVVPHALPPDPRPTPLSNLSLSQESAGVVRG